MFEICGIQSDASNVDEDPIILYLGDRDSSDFHSVPRGAAAKVIETRVAIERLPTRAFIVSWISVMLVATTLTHDGDLVIIPA